MLERVHTEKVNFPEGITHEQLLGLVQAHAGDELFVSSVYYCGDTLYKIGIAPRNPHRHVRILADATEGYFNPTSHSRLTSVLVQVHSWPKRSEGHYTNSQQIQVDSVITTAKALEEGYHIMQTSGDWPKWTPPAE